MSVRYPVYLSCNLTLKNVALFDSVLARLADEEHPLENCRIPKEKANLLMGDARFLDVLRKV